jgi:hypothetical protein
MVIVKVAECLTSTLPAASTDQNWIVCEPAAVTLIVVH